MYPEEFVKPMREELTRVGFRELRSAQEVDAALKNENRTVLVVVNSICGCAAGKARPAIVNALSNSARPEVLTTVFAGQDQEATARARSLLYGLCAVVTFDRADARRQAGVYAGAAGYRDERSDHNFAEIEAGFR